ncbi:hypothetical protein ILYODFUR_037595 [Ilyodon furcidens]|uniref:Uncharacterized protein n=1 Tax=Ilyodon furcidens TaxID=33524 RepID=A0ABV0U5A0_9TELE
MLIPKGQCLPVLKCFRLNTPDSNKVFITNFCRPCSHTEEVCEQPFKLSVLEQGHIKHAVHQPLRIGVALHVLFSVRVLYRRSLLVLLLLPSFPLSYTYSHIQ